MTPPQHPDREGRIGPDGRPETFWIVPDDYHVPYAGTAADGRRFFLSEELFAAGGSSYVAVFLWNADGTFDEVRVDPLPAAAGGPPGRAAPAGAAELVDARLAELGGHRLEPIEVQPFLVAVDGVEFGWRVRDVDGELSINVEPGDFICFYEPWDGEEYDT